MATNAAELVFESTVSSAMQPDAAEQKQPEFRDSMSGFWPLFEIFPVNRLTFARTAKIGNCTTRIPHLGACRKIHQNQKIHYSITHDENYTPKARPRDKNPSFWGQLRSQTYPGSIELLERDMFYIAADVVKDLLAGKKTSLDKILADETGPQYLYDEVVEQLRLWSIKEQNPEEDIHIHQLLRTMLDDFEKKVKKIRLKRWGRIHTSLAKLLSSGVDEDYRETARDFQRRFSKDLNCLVEFKGHTSWVNAVAVSADGKVIASGGGDGTVRIWDGEEQQQQQDRKPLQGDVQVVYSLALLPDGKRLVSGSLDGAIRIWDSSREKLKQEGQRLPGHEVSVASLAASSDGTRIVSGSVDGTIRIWEAELWKEVQTLAGKGPVKMVAISPDSKYIVSGHQDGTLLTWTSESKVKVSEAEATEAEARVREAEAWAQDTEIQVQAVGPDGKVTGVNCFAISPDRTRIVCGHKDNFIRIWDAKTGTLLVEPLQGHTDTVQTVAISPHDGKHIVSGSSDHTVRIWDLKTGKQVWEPLQGHTDSVNCVAISLDGKRIVSGSGDIGFKKGLIL